MINFEATKAVFSQKSNWELKKSYYLFSILKYSFLVKIGSLLLKISMALLTTLPISIIKLRILQMLLVAVANLFFIQPMVIQNQGRIEQELPQTYSIFLLIGKIQSLAGTKQMLMEFLATGMSSL
mgnify:CR=1 FL=1